MKLSRTYEVNTNIHGPRIKKLHDVISQYRFKDGKGINVAFISLINGKAISDPIQIDVCQFYSTKFTQSIHIRVEIEGQIDAGEIENVADSFGNVFSEVL